MLLNYQAKSSKRFYENSQDNSLNSNIINDIFDLADSTISLVTNLSSKLWFIQTSDSTLINLCKPKKYVQIYVKNI